MKKIILLTLFFANFLVEASEDYKKFTGKYFVVLNVASEMLRLYERNCSDERCFNKMILETEVVVGEDQDLPMGATGKGRTILGSYRVIRWQKFYEDGAGHYPAWYNESYPALPPAMVHQPTLWFSEKYMPVSADGKRIGKMRGAFGWYTAFVAPEPYGQWLHGTMGWGADKDYYISSVKNLLINIALDPRSSGCVRNNNEAIAYLREILDVGTPFIKIYAIERAFDPTSPRYTEKFAEWKYILTKNDGLKAGRESVLKSLNISSEDLDNYWKIKQSQSSIILDPSDPLNQVLEVGTYKYDIHPDAVTFIPGERISRYGRKFNRNGNIYGISSRDMSGLFFVDTGILYNYQHPKSVLQVSGFLDEVTPPWMEQK